MEMVMETIYCATVDTLLHQYPNVAVYRWFDYALILYQMIFQSASQLITKNDPLTPTGDPDRFGGVDLIGLTASLSSSSRSRLTLNDNIDPSSRAFRLLPLPLPPPP